MSVFDCFKIPRPTTRCVTYVTYVLMLSNRVDISVKLLLSFDFVRMELKFGNQSINRSKLQENNQTLIHHHRSKYLLIRYSN